LGAYINLNSAGDRTYHRKEEATTMEDLLTKRIGTTKRVGTTKRIEETKEAYSNAGADGDYTVTLPDGDTITIQGAIAVKVLAHGELNLVTDTGRWYLFAPNAWRSATPNQPEPGNSGA
jgi:hypothetical protein